MNIEKNIYLWKISILVETIKYQYNDPNTISLIPYPFYFKW
ncbi:hypothetical protein LEP1GSC049_0019 [Leptospira kirschneri serovar Cynopteri str. 3522 CT]|nr:hypothetical protein LEP1GSC049_0019 [Leptospira kirschneri serovar Cynopteri str. 3522 CT]